MCGEGDHVIARAEYDFDGEEEEELSFHAGDILRLAPKGKQPHIRGWLLGTADGLNEGVIPANYVKIWVFVVGKRNQKASRKEMPKNHRHHR
ncbi:peroxisomal membrane protein PEX13-like isoform X2 [Acropora muricata]|uniref:peroxisomal membrane protein PEX13-like isoform X2 n=1 Tax=Acropora muricata TaxID=159855 RepID=UPI0034E3CB8F